MMAENRGLVLVAEDERPIADLLGMYLRREGFGVHTVADGQDALTAARRLHPVAVVLDVGLPSMDGTEVCRTLRAEGSTVPILFCTARDDEIDRVLGLEMGGDDYITKPFSPREVVARVRTVLRRTRPAASDGSGKTDDGVLRFDGLTVDVPRREVATDAGPVELTALDFDILAALAASPGRVFSRAQLLESVWGYDFYGDERVVDVHVRTLRHALGDDATAPRMVGTVRGVGYKFLLKPKGA